MTPARRAAVAVGAAALLALSAPAAHAYQRPAQGAPPSHGSSPAPTPYMGWNTYYGLGAPTETEVRKVADFLVGSGLKSSGYDIVWLDGGWQADDPRDGRGRLVAHPDRFPSGIPALVDYLHKRGLRAGIYTDAGTYDGGETCGLGSRGHYQEDARQFAGWKVDAIKVDFLCGITEKLDPGPAFKEFGDAVAKSGRLHAAQPVQPADRRLGDPAHTGTGRPQRLRVRTDDRRLLADGHRHRVGHPVHAASGPTCCAIWTPTPGTPKRRGRDTTTTPTT